MTELTPEQEMKALATDLTKATDEVKKFAEGVQTEMKNLGKLSEETKANADKALTEMGTIAGRLTDVEQKIARGTTANAEEAKTLGALFLEDEEVKKFLSGNKRGNAHLTIEGKSVINLTSGTPTVGATTSVGTSLVTPDRVGMVPLPQRNLAVRDLITPGETVSNNIEYARQVTFQNLAATVAEAANKPQSDMTFNLVSAPVRTIAHYMKASRQIMDDAPQLRSFIDGILTYGLKFVEDQQLLTGDGTGQNLTGLVTAATAYSAPFAEPAGTTAIDRIRFAMLQAALALYPSTGIVLNPTDRLGGDRDPQGLPRPLYHRRSAGSGRRAPVGTAGCADARHGRRQLPDRRVPGRRADLRPDADRNPAVDRRWLELHPEHGHHPGGRAPGTGDLRPRRVHHRHPAVTIGRLIQRGAWNGAPFLLQRHGARR